MEDLGVESHQLPAMPIRDFLKVIWTTPTVLLCMGAFMLDNFVGMVLLTWMPAFLYEKFNLSLAMAGLTATIFIQLASMVGSPRRMDGRRAPQEVPRAAASPSK